MVPSQGKSAEKGAKVAKGTSAQELLMELAVAAERQAEVVAQLRAQHVGESSAMDEENACLRAQLAKAHTEAKSAKAYAKKVAQDKVSILADLKYARGKLQQMEADASWSVAYLNERRAEHFANIQEFKERMDKIIQFQEEKLRRLSIEYDEELYPHLMSTIAERRYFFVMSRLHNISFY